MSIVTLLYLESIALSSYMKSTSSPKDSLKVISQTNVAGLELGTEVKFIAEIS